MAESISDPVLKQPLPAIIDTLARRFPDKPFITIAKHVNSTEGSFIVTWSMVARAVDRAAHWLDQNLVATKENPSYSFLAPNFDFRYMIFAFAGIKTGRRSFFPSPRNSEEFQLHLVEKLNIETIVSDIPVGSYAEKGHFTVLKPPSLEELVASGDYKDYPYNKTLEEVWDQEIIVVHSSGSTGPPKPIVWTNAYIEGTRKLMEPTKYGNSIFQTMLSGPGLTLGALPMFHTGGILANINVSVFYGTQGLMYPTEAPLNAQGLCDVTKTFHPKRAFAPPAVLEDIVADDDKLTVLKTFDSISFGGAAISEEAGKKLRENIQDTYTIIGSSEASVYPMSAPPVKDSYCWFRFPQTPGFTMRPDADGLYELVFERTDKFDWPVFHVFPDKTEYKTNDLYEKHPTVADTWKSHGRKDDVLVLSNGEKAVPPPLEDVIRASPIVTGALYFGHGKSTVGLLVEVESLALEQLSKEQILEQLRPYIDKANVMAPAFAQITMDMVVLTKKEKPMKRAGKGSTIRRASIAEYSDEIEEAYSHLDAVTAVPLVKNLSEEGTQEAVLHVFKNIVEKEFGVNQDLFYNVGIDSMQVIAAQRVLKASVGAEAPEAAKHVSTSFIYANPTVVQLAKAIRSLVATGAVATGDRDAAAELIRSMVSKYSEGLPEAVPYVNDGLDKINAVVTGTTGSLGSYMLDLLIRDSKVGHIFALNRAEDGGLRQVKGNSLRGLSTDFSKVTFIKSDFAKRNLGISPSEYKQLVKSSDLIIHNAWPVNFNQTLKTFESQIAGTRNFIDLAAASPRHPQIVFISSVGTLAGWDQFNTGKPAPEEILDDTRYASPGYGQSKLIAENVLKRAAEFGVNTTIARVGQVAGPVDTIKGEWVRQEWFPSIVFSSEKMGSLPTSIGSGPLEWIPVNLMAQIVLDLGCSDLAARNSQAKVGTIKAYNLSNPKSANFDDLAQVIKERLNEPVECVPWSNWVEKVRADSEDPSTDASKHPAVKLIDFYESLAGDGSIASAGLTTDRCLQTSQTMKGLRAANREWMDTWMTQWGY